MLNNAKTLRGYKLHSLDGEIGKVKEFYFDDHLWTIRYLVADTGNWLTGRQVLISPNSLSSVNKEGQYISVKLTMKQIEASPSLDEDKPVSRQYEEIYYGYYGWPFYWDTPIQSGAYPDIAPEHERRREFIPNRKKWDPRLRSTIDVTGYHVQAKDGGIGHVEDFIIDVGAWKIRYLVVNTRNWWFGKKVLISPEWIDRVSWEDSKVFTNLSRENIRQSPEYAEESLLTRDYETELHGHYNREGYWVDEPSVKEHSH